ncbi:CXADR-like membrane protein [Anabas testudineus]|uniref:CXADR-like membrane protein n=1 Tax=Anabas testudineus TaxID=64144 RepID=UPI000E45F39F|nr:CXADR-like membrane protein [Anabas testudineus]XP_033182674.1 CXADR-like membrane protein [Anabas testudineus]
MKAKPGDDVVLQCDSLRVSAITVLKWIRIDLQLEGYIFFFRENRGYENYQDPSYRDRVELKDPKMKDGDASVILENVTLNDTGTYECHIGYEGTHDLINIHLTVDPGDAAGRKDGGDMRGHLGLIAVSLTVVVLVVAGLVGFVLYRKGQKDRIHTN